MKEAIYPCVWFNGNANEATRFYQKAFTNLTIIDTTPLVIHIDLGGKKIMCLNGGPTYTPNPAVSFFIVVESVQELLKSWEILIEGGNVQIPLGNYGWSEKYGWLNDKYGVSWQLFLGKKSDFNQSCIPNLLFTGKLAGKSFEAIEHYRSIFKNSSLIDIHHYTPEDDDVEGYVKHARFRLNNTLFIAMDSSLTHPFPFSEANSFVVECDTQDEIDYYWEKLTDGGIEGQCGWLKDKFGLSWQIIPSILPGLMKDIEKSERVIQAFLQMRKFNIEALLNA